MKILQPRRTARPWSRSLLLLQVTLCGYLAAIFIYYALPNWPAYAVGTDFRSIAKDLREGKIVTRVFNLNTILDDGQAGNAEFSYTIFQFKLDSIDGNVMSLSVNDRSIDLNIVNAQPIPIEVTTQVISIIDKFDDHLTQADQVILESTHQHRLIILNLVVFSVETIEGLKTVFLSLPGDWLLPSEEPDETDLPPYSIITLRLQSDSLTSKYNLTSLAFPPSACQTKTLPIRLFLYPFILRLKILTILGTLIAGYAYYEPFRKAYRRLKGSVGRRGDCS